MDDAHIAECAGKANRRWLRSLAVPLAVPVLQIGADGIRVARGWKLAGTGPIVTEQSVLTCYPLSALFAGFLAYDANVGPTILKFDFLTSRGISYGGRRL
jgi:hypothetical protein